MTHLLAASRLYNPFVPGSSFINYPLSVIFCEQATPPFENAETVVHELGHRMGLRPGNGGNFQHIDKDHPGQSDRIVKTHDGLIACVMGYDNPSDGTAEFCIDCILTGSTTGAEDSLRDCVDQ